MSRTEKDRIYSSHIDLIPPFEFDENVVNVFDDMIHRSVPFYRETVKRQAQLAAHFYRQGTNNYDFGCSHGNFGIAFIEEICGSDFRMIAADSSGPMIGKYRERLENIEYSGCLSLVCSDIRDVKIENMSVAVMNLTLQFLPVEDRKELVKNIYDALHPGGIFLITEKIHHMNRFVDELEQKFYYRFKKENGYSSLEISQKREALEDVLIPETVEEHMERFRRAGFENTAIWHKWFNFCSFLCIKS